MVLTSQAGGRSATMRILGLAGWSGAGKTTLLTRLIPCLRGRGLTVSTIKHAHHRFDVDQPGKDSHAHREAGAELFISDRTVETHVSSVLRKLQLSNRHELTRWAARRGYA